MENNSAPPELLALKQPNGHVPYVNHINVVLLAGPHTATLEDGFVSNLQHDSVRCCAQDCAMDLMLHGVTEAAAEARPRLHGGTH
jgi:hypothetical protein